MNDNPKVLREIADRIDNTPCCGREKQYTLREEDLKLLAVWPLPQMYETRDGMLVPGMGLRSVCLCVYMMLGGKVDDQEKLAKVTKPCELLAEFLRAAATRIEGGAF